jgi:hypothetical protein
MAETTYEMLQQMTVGELLTEAATVGNDRIEMKITKLIGEHWSEIDTDVADLADQIDARNRRLWEESIADARGDDALDYCF